MAEGRWSIPPNSLLRDVSSMLPISTHSAIRNPAWAEALTGWADGRLGRPTWQTAAQLAAATDVELQTFGGRRTLPDGVRAVGVRALRAWLRQHVDVEAADASGRGERSNDEGGEIPGTPVAKANQLGKTVASSDGAAPGGLEPVCAHVGVPSEIWCNGIGDACVSSD